MSNPPPQKKKNAPAPPQQKRQGQGKKAGRAYISRRTRDGRDGQRTLALPSFLAIAVSVAEAPGHLFRGGGGMGGQTRQVGFRFRHCIQQFTKSRSNTYCISLCTYKYLISTSTYLVGLTFGTSVGKSSQLYGVISPSKKCLHGNVL